MDIEGAQELTVKIQKNRRNNKMNKIMSSYLINPLRFYNATGLFLPKLNIFENKSLHLSFIITLK
jgi:hypothetical protein